MRLWMPILCLTFATHPTMGGDWPGLLGPHRNGQAEGENIARHFPVTGPKKLWQMDVGTGYAGPAIAGDKAIVFHRLGKENVVECRAMADGKALWAHRYRADYVDGFNFDNGPRAVPTIDGGRVYTFGAEGMLLCLNMADGKIIWSVDTRDQFKTDKSYFGRVSSPWIEGNQLILNLGGKDQHGIAAFDKINGKVLWGATDHPAGYSSPTAATNGNRRYGLCFTRTGLVALNPANGKVDFIERWRSRVDASVNAACPIVHGEKVFVSACYQTGAMLLQITPQGPKKVWSGDDILNSHYATPVYHKGFLFGYHGRQEQRADFRCVDWATGKVKWTKDLGGVGSVMVAEGRLILLTEGGKLVIAPATDEGFLPTAQSKILGSGIRAHPALSNGRLLARDKKKLICVQIGVNGK